MSEVTSSENNSIMSENNSFEDISNQNSIESPPPPSSSNQSNVRRLSNTFNSTTSSSSSPQTSHNNLLTDSSHELTSLPIFSSSQTNMTTFANDPELSGLLTRKNPKFTPQAPKCAKCAKNVYMAEELRAANKTFHKLCFKCTLCNKLLEPNILTEHQGDLFCKNCYGKKFGPKGYGYGNGAGILSSDTGMPNDAYTSTSPSNTTIPTTPNSMNGNHEAHSIYTNKTSSLKSTFSTHDTPMTAYRTSNSNSATNNTQVDFKTPVTANYAKATTPNENSVSNINSNRQSIVSNTSSSSSSEKLFNFGVSEKCARCQKSVYAAEKVIAASKSYHKLCFTCSTCKKSLSSMSCCDNNYGDIFCKVCYGKQYGPKGVGYGIGAGTLQTN